MPSSAKIFATIQTGSGGVQDSALDYYGRRVATACNDGTVRVFDVVEGEIDASRAKEIKNHQGVVWKVDWAHPKWPGTVASCGYDRSVVISKESSSGQFGTVHKCSEARASVNALKFAPYQHGLHLAACSSDGHLAIYSYKNGQFQRQGFAAHPAGVLCLDWELPDSAQGDSGKLEDARMVTGGVDGGIKVWRHTEEKWTEEVVDTTGATHKNWVTCVAFRPYTGQTHLLASGSKDGSVFLWAQTNSNKGATWRPVKVLGPEKFGGAEIWAIEFSSTGGLLVSAGENQTYMFKETPNGEFEQVLEFDENGVRADTPGESHPGLTDETGLPMLT